VNGNGPSSLVVVAAAVIERDGRFLVSRRLDGTHLAGLWEFPGGKCEPGETHDACLRRELREELGVDAVIHEQIVQTDFAYVEKAVRLHFRRCDIVGDPQARLGQELRWVTRKELQLLELPDGDRELVALLVTATGAASLEHEPPFPD
jgi:mutator protein MutT